MPVFLIRIGQFAPRMAPRRRYNSPVRWPTPTHDQGRSAPPPASTPDHYRVWVHEGPEATAPATAGREEGAQHEHHVVAEAEEHLWTLRLRREPFGAARAVSRGRVRDTAPPLPSSPVSKRVSTVGREQDQADWRSCRTARTLSRVLSAGSPRLI
jgi:hypothetical protein